MTLRKTFPDVRLRKTSTMFKTYTGECVQPVGKFMADVRLHSQHRKLPLYVIESGSNPLLGRDWLREIQLNWAEIKAVHMAEAINQHSTKPNRGIQSHGETQVTVLNRRGRFKTSHCQVQTEARCSAKVCEGKACSLFNEKKSQ